MVLFSDTFVPVPYCFDCIFVICFEITKYEAFSFVLFAQDCFDYSRPFVVPYEFWNFFFNFGQKNALRIFKMHCTESVDCSGSMDILAILSSNPCLFIYMCLL